MSFSLSTRFPDDINCSPSPAAYSIPTTFEENASKHSGGGGGVWPKPCACPAHKCTDDCLRAECDRSARKERHGDLLKRHFSFKRHSLGQNSSKFTYKEDISEKELQCGKPRMSLQSDENKENLPSPPKASGIPRIKRTVTEGHAPSFMSRPRIIHNCFPATIEEHFNRHSAQRKSVKPIKKREQSNEDSHKPNLKKLRPFNVSYTVLPRIEENPQKKIDNVTDDKKLLNKIEDGALKEAHDIFAMRDCNVIFLVNEEFIDDDYDSYMKDLTGSKGHLQVLQNKELYEMTKYLVRLYLDKPQKGLKIGKSVAKKFPNKTKRASKAASREPMWEDIVKATISELKGQFQREIYNKTQEKLDKLTEEIKEAASRANEDIEDACERTMVNLIARLHNIMQK